MQTDLNLHCAHMPTGTLYWIPAQMALHSLQGLLILHATIISCLRPTEYINSLLTPRYASCILLSIIDILATFKAL